MQATKVQVGERLQASAAFTAEEVSQFAKLAGDDNPIHHNLDAAKAANFDQLVVSGTHLCSRLMGLTATHFSTAVKGAPEGAEPRSMLGLDFRFRFKRAVFADDPLEFSWEVVAVRPKASLRGEIVFLAGRVRSQAQGDAVKAVGKVLVR